MRIVYREAIQFKHLGDITEINGRDLEPVDVVTGGSPCQDFSVASKTRHGLLGERSGLFMEQIRIVKELRNKDKDDGRTGADVRPRYMVFENVPGIFNSNEGRDFKAVLEEIIRIEEPNCPDLPQISKWRGKWTKSGCVYDDMGRWSIAWRIHDSQYWGTPQRRKRVALVVDFGGMSAPEICFERRGITCDHNQSAEDGEDITKNVTHEAPGAISFVERFGKAGGGKGILIQFEKAFTITTIMAQRVFDTIRVRRFTPTECERLQGFPDGWTDIGEWVGSNGRVRKWSSDMVRFRALGNSISTPFWFYLLRKISAQYERPATLGSLFDGISGFPYCWARINGAKSCKWSSEIDDFSIAVSKKHFGDDDDGTDGDFYEVIKGTW